ncbi:hypothetical protein [Streptomyces sp. AC550_RSS872]|uniref:hypothetical protein n=1 Tax=Streptomyces sp. AC550_RSS872 TaxID=2823689 RepID=UPI001C27CD23|nr:hypothetical protein [Streptomyces sp. AC550_RSS872]
MTTPTVQAPAAAQQAHGTHHFVITLEKPGQFSMTQEGTFTPPPGSTRQDAYLAIYQAVTAQNPRLKGASVGFFLLEPNQL